MCLKNKCTNFQTFQGVGGLVYWEDNIPPCSIIKNGQGPHGQKIE